MTFVDILTAFLILGLFFSGLSQAVMPMQAAWNNAVREYKTTESIEFIAISFRNECAKPDRNIENWKRAVAGVLELEAYEITEMRQGGILRAYKLSCVIGGQAVDVIGVCNE